LKRAVIEYGSLDLLRLFQDVSAEAKKEKTAVPPISKLVYYWTRKPLIVSRAVLLASTLDNVDDVRSLLGLDMKKRSYHYAPDNSKYTRLLGASPSSLKFLDPFGGSGNITFEAKCLGLSCTSSDYNPLAYVIEKATLDYPARYGNSLITDVKKFALEVIHLTEKELSKFYKPADRIYFWYWCMTCPHCNQIFPLSNHMYLAKNTRKKIGLTLSTTEHFDFIAELKNPISDMLGNKFTQKRGNAICIRCHNTISYSDLTEHVSTHKTRRLLAVQSQRSGKTFFRLADKDDLNKLVSASEYFQSNLAYFLSSDLISQDPIRPTHGRNHKLWNYGITTWDQFLSTRQSLVMATFIKNSRSVCSSIHDPTYRQVISTYLGLLLCKHINSNTLGVVYNKSGEKPEIVTMLRFPAFVYNHVEINPFAKVRGSLHNSLSNILDAIKFSTRCNAIPQISMRSVLNLDNGTYDLIITDPPYADDVEYGEVSDFLYVWFYRCVKDFIPGLPKIAQLDEDFCEPHGRFTSTKLAKDFFAAGLQQSFLAMRKSLKDDGLLVVFFAHSTTEAWDLLLRCVIEAKFQVVSTHAVHTESPSNVIARNKVSFMSSIVVTCRKITTDSRAYFEDIKPNMFKKIDSLLDQISQTSLIKMPVTDLLIMVYGEVLEVATGHTELKSYEKNFQPSFDTLMSEARNYLMVKLMSKLTGKFSESLDTASNIYILAKVFYDGHLTADEFAKIIKAYGIQSKNLPDYMFKSQRDQILFASLHDAIKGIDPFTVQGSDVYSQLRYVVSLAFQDGVNNVKSFLSKGDASAFNPAKIKAVISLFIKSYSIRTNQGHILTISEKQEFETLKNLALMFNLKISESDSSLTHRPSEILPREEQDND